ncbi:MAG: WG repeat-containing protein [Prevotella sp.]|nr:WG repeat-containing protein [Prevotella sp.]MBR1556741.1 WG repeat-containing protein [Prevotella sp.]
MKKELKQVVYAVVCIATTMLTIISCGEQSKDDLNFDYLAVQMSKGDSWSIIDKEGKVVVKEEYPSDASISPIYNETYWVKTDEKYQLYNLSDPKKPIIDDEFAKATKFEAGVAAVSNPNKQIQIIDTKGSIIATLGKDIKRCYLFTEKGYGIIENTEGQRGLIDNKGKILIKPKYGVFNITVDDIIIAKKSTEDKVILILDINEKKLGEISLDKYEFVNNASYEEKIIVKEANNEDGHFIVLDKTGKKLFDIKKAKKPIWGSYYKNGYITFDNGEGKTGLANDKGEIVIRPKYEYIYNFGNGEFSAKKNGKFGIINDKDETIIEFDYDEWYYMMGNNHILKDGSSWSLIGKDGKEITSFEAISASSDLYAEYVDVEGLAASIYNRINEYEQALPASQLAKKLSLDMDKYHYSSRVDFEVDYEGKISAEYMMWYDGYLAEEKTHEVEENDGWFTSRHTVSDGWDWTNNTPNTIHGKLTLKDNGISIKDIYKSLIAKLSEGRKKNSEGIFTKNIKLNGKTTECKTEIMLNSDDITVNINFNR